MRWLVAVLLALYTMQGWRYAHVWSSDLALWEHAARHAPFKPRPHINLAKYLIEADRLNDAYRVTQRADQLLQQPHIGEHERRLSRRIIEQNLLLLSYAQEVAARP